jgi:hypothetical protein
VFSDKDVVGQHENIARNLGMTVAQLIGEEALDIPKADVAWKFIPMQPLVRPEKIRHLPTQIRKLHDWYLEYSKEW